jgi:transmembrane sensor
VGLVLDSVVAVDRAAFERWRAADPRHGEAYARAERAWEHAALLGRTSFGRARALPPSRRRVGAAPALRYTLVAVLLLGICVAGFVVSGERGVSPAPGREIQIAAAIGEIRRVVLNDGSIVTLDTDSLVRVGYSQRARSLRLVRGRARFDVARDPARRFVVSAGGAEVIAHGTLFDVSLIGPGVKVALLRGAVDVGTTSVGRLQPARQVVRLRPGQQLAFVPAVHAPALRPVRAGESGWPSGMLSFSNTRLIDAVTDANRYSRIKIMLADPGIAELRVSGAYRIGDAPGLAASLAASLGLRAAGTSRPEIMISRAAPQP